MIRFNNIKVLLVEDKADDQKYFEDILLDVGIDVRTAANGKDAMQVLGLFMPEDYFN